MKIGSCEMPCLDGTQLTTQQGKKKAVSTSGNIPEFQHIPTVFFYFQDLGTVEFAATSVAP